MLDIENYSPEERIEILKANADKVFEDEVSITLGKGELEELKQRQNSLILDKKRLEEEKKDVNASYNKKIKEANTELNETAKTIREGRKTEQGTVYALHNHEADKAEFYNSKGELLYSRPLTDDERKNRTIYSEMRKAE
jgi:septal ring factor EnvC (AmiA/AmiB activator)